MEESSHSLSSVHVRLCFVLSLTLRKGPTPLSEVRKGRGLSFCARARTHAHTHTAKEATPQEEEGQRMDGTKGLALTAAAMMMYPFAL